MDENSSEDHSARGDELIPDKQLPEDLRPAEDNPLAQPDDRDNEGGGLDPQEQGTA